MKSFLLLALLSAAAAPAYAQRASATLDCKPTGRDFVYDCAIALSRSGKPLTGAQVTLGADMPSMPMAHNVRPSKAVPFSSNPQPFWVGRETGSTHFF